MSRHVPLLVTFLSLQATPLTAGATVPAESPGQRDGVLQLPLITLDQPVQPVGMNKTKRQAGSDLDEYFYGGKKPVAALGVPIQIGTPPQTVILEPDTASDHFWVVGLRDGHAREEPRSVYFDAKSSISFQNLTKLAAARYGSAGNDNYVLTSVADDVSFAGKYIGQLKFGMADMNTQRPRREVGILPLGRQPARNSSVQKQYWADVAKKNPAQAQNYWKKQQADYDSLGVHFDSLDDLLGMWGNYDNFWTSVLDKQVISERTFGMAVREKGRGGLTLGGLDTGKFSGALHKLPITNNADQQYIVAMQSLVCHSSGSASTTSMIQSTANRIATIGLDSGSPGLIIPDSAFRALKQATSAGKNNAMIEVDCATLKANTFTLEFRVEDDLSIKIPLADFKHSEKNNGKTCLLAIQKGGYPADAWIGGHFLRRAYVVFDPDRQSVYIGNGADCGSKLVASKNGVPAGLMGDCQTQAQNGTPPVAPPAPGSKPASGP